MYTKSSEVGGIKVNDSTTVTHRSICTETWQDSSLTYIKICATPLVNIHIHTHTYMRTCVYIYIHICIMYNLQRKGCFGMAIRESRENWRITLRKYPSSPAKGCHFEDNIFSGSRGLRSGRNTFRLALPPLALITEHFLPVSRVI